MKKLAIVMFACALAVGAAACGKKKAPANPTNNGGGTGSGSAMGGSTYGGAGYGSAMPDGGGNPCGGAANPCGGG